MVSFFFSFKPKQAVDSYCNHLLDMHAARNNNWPGNIYNDCASVYKATDLDTCTKTVYSCGNNIILLLRMGKRTLVTLCTQMKATHLNSSGIQVNSFIRTWLKGVNSLYSLLSNCEHGVNFILGTATWLSVNSETSIAGSACPDVLLVFASCCMPSRKSW